MFSRSFSDFSCPSLADDDAEWVGTVWDGVTGSEMDTGVCDSLTNDGDLASSGDNDGFDTGADFGAELLAIGVEVEAEYGPELEEDGIADGGGPVAAEPVSRSTKFLGAVLPLKNSEAVSAGSVDGAGGKISDWNESDFRGTMNEMGSIAEP